MNINFPSPASPGDTFVASNNVLYTYDGAKWTSDGSGVGVVAYGNTQVGQYLSAGVVGNIIPFGDAVYSLGNSTHQWNDLYISGSTIYLDSVPISLTAGNVITVNGQPVLSNDSTTSITTTGNISADYFIGNGSQLTGLSFSASSISNGSSNVTIPSADSNISVTANGSYTWTFDTFGTLTAPGNIIPDANITYNLGNNLNRWSSIYALVYYGNGSQLTDIDTSLISYGNSAVEIPIVDGNIVITANASSTWTFGTNESLTLPGGSRLRPLGANLDIFAGAGSYVNLITSDESTSVGVDGGGGYITTAGGTWDFDTTGNLTVPGNILGSGNILIAPDSASASSYLDIYLTGGPDIHIASNDNSIVIGRDTGANVFVGNDGEVSIRTDDGATPQVWNFDDTGNLTVPGNIIMTTGIVGSGASPAPYLSGFSSVSAIAVTATGNVTAGNVVTTGTGGNITMTGGNILGVNVVTANSFVGNGATLSNVATQVTGSWTVPVGNSTQSFTVTPNETYYLWVDCNIPNGILAWNATATVTNTNVPVVGAQYAWVYSGSGTPIDFTSIPNQFTGTANTIVRSSVAPSATTNRFDFGINNISGNSVVVNYGYTKIS